MVVNVIAVFGLGLFLRNYLSSYMGQKGTNLATKEDIGEITRSTEEVTSIFQREMAVFSNDLTFTNDYAFNRYSILYAKIYGIVVQSEYLRYFFKTYQNKDFGFEEYPFIEINRSKVKQKKNFITNVTISETVDPINDEMTSFNKNELCNYIIDNSEYASPKLLKLAIAYRYTSSNYGEQNLGNESLLESFNNAEFALIKEIVKTIVIEYNEMRKTVKLSYSEQELENGELEHTEFK